MSHDKPLAAAGAVFTAMAILGLADNTVTIIARDTGLWQFHAVRAVLAIVVLITLAGFGMVRIRAHRRWAVALRGGFTATAMLIYFGSLAFLSVGQAAAGLFSAPIWVMLISALFLGQPVGWTRITAAIVGFAGVLLVLNPFADGVGLIALAPLTAGVFYAVAGIATRQWCDGESTSAMLLWFFVFLLGYGLIGTLVMTTWPHAVPAGPEGFILRGATLPGPLSLGLIVLQAGSALLAVGLIIRSYQLGDAATVAIFEYSLMIFAALWGWVLFDQTLTPLAMLGVGLIIASGAIISLRSRG